MSEKRKLNTEAEEDDEPSSPAWMTTYGDMMTLLMTFFILIMSFSTIELDKFKAAMGSLKGAFGILGDSDKIRPDQSWYSPYQVSIKKVSILEHVENLKEMIRQLNMEDEIEVFVNDSEVIIHITDKIMFNSGDAKLKPKFLPLLSKIAQTIIVSANDIKITGHSDNIPIHTKKYPSNWELSLDRALSVMEYLVHTEKINPATLSVSGNAEYRPLVPNNSPRNRAKNRRVEINVKW